MNTIDFRRDLLPLKDRIFRLALRITLNRPEAEDLTQDTLVRVWTRRDELTDVASIEAYCLTVCRHLALDRIALSDNRNASIDDAAAEAPDTAPTPDEQLERDERLERVHQIVSRLPERMRTCLQLRDIEGKTYAEAAAIMDISEDLFRVTLHRARRSVKEQYEKLLSYGL